MEYNLTSLESLKFEHSHLDLAIKEEERHIWKNLIRIETLKKQKLKTKDEILRRSLQCRSN